MKNPWDRKVSWVLPSPMMKIARRNTKLKIKFYDTCALLSLGEKVFNGEPFAVSSITFKELENIKTSFNKDNDVKAMARHLLHLFNEHEYDYIPVVHQVENEARIAARGFEINNDTKILSDAIQLAKSDEEIVFVTADLSLRCIARHFIDIIEIEPISEEEDGYMGYIEIECTEEQLAFFYEHQEQNVFNLLEGQYLVLYHNNEVVDLRVWRDGQPQFVNSKDFNSKLFGKVSPYKGDIYQKMLFDSLHENQLTVIRGHAGTGKSYLGLAALFDMLEHYKIDNIYIICNPVAARDFAKLGFLPGDRTTKLLDSQIGNFLIGKLGDISIVEQLMNDGKLHLIPAADCRGMDISTTSGVYITEAQNSSIDMMKLMLQRMGENCKVVIEGDDDTQVDMNAYAGSNNGLRRLSQVFRGEDFYGEVRLQTCHRGRIASRAELM